MIWFFQAAHEIVSKYDKPNDHDGARHFEYGMGLMVGKMLELIQKARGMESAEQAADFIVKHVENWKYCRRLLRAQRSPSAVSEDVNPNVSIAPEALSEGE
jgi:hypothetical protein